MYALAAKTIRSWTDLVNRLTWISEKIHFKRASH